MKQTEMAKWLKGILLVCALIGLLLCAVVVPMVGKNAAGMNAELTYMFWPCLVFIWITAIPFYAALWNAWLICMEIAKDNSFCMHNAAHLKTISKLALLECLLYLTAVIVLVALNVYHFSVLLAALFIIFIGVSVAVASAVLSYLVEKASALKQDNDLTI